MDQHTEIVLINKGKSWFLPYVLHQAMHASPRSKVVLIADRQHYDGIRTELLAGLESDDLAEFRKRYVHMSTNPVRFELFCWDRWFYLRNYMREKGVGTVLYLDSDVLLQSGVDEIRSAYAGVDWRCALSVPEGGPASGHVSYWTLELLEEFCSFTIRTFSEREFLARYREKWEWHLAHGAPGGVCDMTTLHLFYQSHRDAIFNLAERRGENVFDNNMNTGANFESGEYLVEYGIKKTAFLSGHPCFFTGDPSTAVRAHALHFQGAAKRHIRKFYKGRPFRGQTCCDARFLCQLLALRMRGMTGR